eukprot:EC095155.1.p3 GENE.EC095155.1~~EC095155.1.p3  ORF type:complete len:101 (+),score=5.10 EC095155.1:115-417(+)
MRILYENWLRFQVMQSTDIYLQKWKKCSIQYNNNNNIKSTENRKQMYSTFITYTSRQEESNIHSNLDDKSIIHKQSITYNILLHLKFLLQASCLYLFPYY